MDFLKIDKRITSRGVTEISPKFVVRKSKDLMIRGKDFYGVYCPTTGFWSTDQDDVVDMIDQELAKVSNECDAISVPHVTRYMWDSDSGSIDAWHKYCQKQMSDNYTALNQTVLFNNSEVTKESFATFKLPYDLASGSTDNWDNLVDQLYTEEEKHKIEWAIGSIVSGKSKTIQKFFVFYGSAGTGKSTILNIIDAMFSGYTCAFEAKSITSSNNDFALEAFKNDPLVAINHDGDLSKIADNARLNSLISHEKITVNAKFKGLYETKFNATLFMGTNTPVKITDSKSGLLRRLIDISPIGFKIPKREYDKLMKGVKFEYGAIAYKCLKVFEENPGYYSHYVPRNMEEETNDFYNFMEEQYPLYIDLDEVSLASAWKDYKDYVEDAKVPYPMSKRVFKNELKNYFDTFTDHTKKGSNMYKGFLREKFIKKSDRLTGDDVIVHVQDFWLQFNSTSSEFDRMCIDMPAQYAKENGDPKYRWQNVKTTLGQINTSKLHYVKIPENHIVIDADEVDPETGEKSLERNMELLKELWDGPPTYAEVSKSGNGIHLHYIYDGDVSNLEDHLAEHLEVKVYKGNASLRRKLSKCNDLPIAHISSGIPTKRKDNRKMLNWEGVKNEQQLRTMIVKNLNKEYHADTTSSINFIKKILDDAYESGATFDVRDLRPAIQSFALNSTNQAENNLRTVSKMIFQSDSISEDIFKEYEEDDPLVFFDVEVFPNVFIVCWMVDGTDKVISMVNPSPKDIQRLCHMKLVGFNNRSYDNHILYACMKGYSNFELYTLSKRIISGSDNAKFGEAYNLSYTDVYDFLSSQNKMSLKKWEIKLHIDHIENEHDWDSDLDPKYWQEVVDYCCNDVRATSAVFYANQADWTARKILADIAEMSPNTTTNTLTGRIIFGDNKHPQDEFVYTDLSTIFPGYEFDKYGIDKSKYNEGTKIVSGKSIYRGEDPGEGGHKIAHPGYYTHVALLDVASMHPHSAIALNIFGDRYTKIFKQIVDARIDIKHGNYEEAKKLFDGKLAPYLTDKQMAKDLANALKTAINSVYGLTSAKFDNLFKDPRNEDNIVAKYGALFMINLKHEIMDRGYTVVHISTDSIKIADADSEIIDFVMEYGKKYGYDFEYEAQYERMCIVNDSVYIARVEKEDGEDVEPYWTATGKEFQVPYVFKTLFSHEDLTYDDFRTTMSVQTALCLDLNEDNEDEHNYHFIGKVGSFIPIKEGCGGGLLMRQSADKSSYSSATGSKGYRWLESNMVKNLNKEKDIDMAYFENMAQKAVDHINEYVDFDEFTKTETIIL